MGIPHQLYPRKVKSTSADAQKGLLPTSSLTRKRLCQLPKRTFWLMHKINQGLLSQKFESNGILVRQATADADSLIVETSLQESKGSKKVMVIATDTDVLLMLIARAPRFNKLSFVSPGSRLYDIESVQKPLKSKRNCLLFLHAITGCDTTSALYKKGKKKAWKLLDNPDVQNLANEFNRRDARKESVISAGEKFITKLYAGREEVKNTKV